MIARHIISVGYEPRLLATRSMVLRHAGYIVNETNALTAALAKLESDLVDALLLCNTIPDNERKWFAAEVLNRRRLLPIICVKGGNYEQNVPGCIGVDNDPAALLNALGLAVR
ncbi:MAG TPA: hypothetical protein VGJ33_12360 [Candidatus Angelobacter sp.]|jgi:DNA-binding response OmpR family regulator